MSFFAKCYQGATLLLVLSLSCSLILTHGVSRILPTASLATIGGNTLSLEYVPYLEIIDSFTCPKHVYTYGPAWYLIIKFFPRLFCTSISS